MDPDKELVKLRDDIEGLLECPQCMEWLQSLNSNSGHPVCCLCFNQSKTRQCPIYKFSNLGVNDVTFLKQLINIFPFKCKFQGCQERFLPQQLKIHEKSCDYRFVDCPLLNSDSSICSNLVTVRDYYKHVGKYHWRYCNNFCIGESWFSENLPNKTDFFKLNILKRKTQCHYSVVYDKWDEVMFIAMIFYDESNEMYQISVHQFANHSNNGRINYIYTIKVEGDDYQRIVYINKCIPDMMSPQDAKEFKPMEFRNIKKVNFKEGNKIEYHLNVTSEEDFFKRKEIRVPIISKRRESFDFVQFLLLTTMISSAAWLTLRRFKVI